MEEHVRLLARSIILVGAHRLQENDYRGIHFNSDQAEEKVKKGTGKIIIKWCVSLATEEFPDGQVMFLVLDSDSTGKKTEQVVAGCVHSIEKLPNGELVNIDGFLSDSGGGGVT